MTLGYSYNPASEIVSNTRSNDAYSFTLANANVASSPDGLNRLASIAGSSIGYDDRGNATSVPAAGSVTGTARNFEYNADNALVVATDSSGGRQEMMPDSLERLHRYYDGSANRWLLYDGHRLIAETNSSATAIARRYVHGPGTDEPLVWYEGSGTGDRRWLHADERGSVVAASDGSGNLVGSINRYDDYGTPQGGSLTGRFGYTGQAWLPAPGLYDYRARFYNPALGGRFMQTTRLATLLVTGMTLPVLRRFLGLAVAWLALSPASVAQNRPTLQNWCARERVYGQLNELTDVDFWAVQSRAQASSVQELRRRTAVALDRASARRLVGPRALPTRGHYYLVRATVFAPEGTRAPRLVELTEAASYHLWYADAGTAVVVVAQPATGSPARAHNIAMILRADVPINDVAVACYSIP